MEIQIPIITRDNIPDYIEFNLRTEKIEVFIYRTSMGDDYLNNCNVTSLDEFIVMYLNKIARANSLDNSKIMSEITRLNKTGNVITYYAYDLKEIFNII